jgi:hypothetical protein
MQGGFMSIKVYHFIIVTLLLISSLSATGLQGIVSDQTGKSITAAQVSACGYDASGDSVFYNTMSGFDGEFGFSDMKTGTYYLSCTRAGYLPYRSGPFTLQGTTNLFMNITLLISDVDCINSISGHVYSVPALLPAFIPLAAADVFLVNNIRSYHTRSDQDGLYEFKNVQPGIYFLSAEAFRHVPQVNIDTIEVVDGIDITGENIYLVPVDASELVSLSGHVWSAGITDQNIPQPVYPAYITLMPGRIYILSEDSSGIVAPDTIYPLVRVKNNPDGSYEIPDIPKGHYNVSCEARGYEPEYVFLLDLTTDDVVQDFYLKPITIPLAGRITGKVYFDKIGSPVTSAYISFYEITGTGLPVIPGDSSRSPDRLWPYGVYTDSTGTYSALLPQGQYYVSCKYDYMLDCFSADCIGYPVYHEFYDDVHRLADATPVSILSGQTTTEINFGIPFSPVVPMVTVTGHVTDDQHTPLERSLVRVWQIDVPVMIANSNCRIYTGYTDENGYYKINFRLQEFTPDATLSPFPVYGFMVSAEKSGYQTEFYKEKSEPYLADKLLAFGDTVFSNIDFTLEPRSGANSINGVILSEVGEALADVFVIGARRGTGEIVFTFSDNYGRYALGNLKEDYYYILFAARHYIPEFYDNVYFWEDATPVLATGLVTGIDASMTPLCQHFNWGMLTGIIRDENGQPLDGAMVLIKNQAGEVLNYGLSDGSGSYQIQGLPDGTNQICVSKVNYSANTTWFDFDVSDFEVLLMNFKLNWNPADIPEEQTAALPSRIELMANYPNPFNPATHIQFGLPAAQQVSLKVYDLTGRQVAQLLKANLAAGVHTVIWNGTDHTGRSVSSGIYFYALQGDGFRLVKKMLLNR